jgi:signal transduction histidine kinase
MDSRTSLLALRWVACATLVLLLFNHQPLPLSLANIDLRGVAACIVLALSNLALHRAPAKIFTRQPFHFLLFLLDLILVTVAVYLATSSEAAELGFFVVLLLCILSGAVTGDPRASFLISLFAGAIYIAQIRLWKTGPVALLDPNTLLRIPLLIILSLIAAILSRGAERTNRRRAEILLAFTGRLRITMSPEEIAATLAEVLTGKAGYNRVGLYVLDPDQVTFRRAGESTFPATISARTLPDSMLRRISSGHAAKPEDLACARVLVKTLRIRPETSFIVPAQASERVIGLLVAEHRRRVFDPGPQVALLGNIAGQAAHAITNARMVQHAQESAIGLHSLLKMSEAVSSTLRTREILQMLEEFCVRLIGVSGCRLWATGAALNNNGPGTAELVPLSGEATPIEHAAAIKAWETGTEVLLNSEEAVEKLGFGGEVSNLLAMPLRTPDEVLGVLVALDKPGSFNQRDHSLLEGLASQATIGLVNARLVERLEARTARISLLVETLGAEKEKLEHVLSNMEEAVVLIDQEGRVALANHSGRRLLAPAGPCSLPAEAARFRDPLGLLPRLAAVLGGDSNVHETLPNGERFYELSATHLKGEDGAIAVLRDITELVRIDAMRTDFVSHVSHELRTPLAAIVGSIKLILDGRAGDITETQNRLLNIVERESSHLMQLINDLLDLAKLEAGHTKIEKEEVDLKALIAEAVESMQPLAQSNSIRLTAEGDGLESLVSCDPSLIRQVLHNLIGNAIKFTPAGGSVRTVGETGPAYAEVKVMDTGIGIPRDKWEAVFNKFEQLGAHKGPVKGTGLGLSICRQIVERHGGRISVESEEGEGSTFRFTLPRGEPIVEVQQAVTMKDESCVSPIS